MKPFNLRDSLAGKPVVTRSGLPVKQLTLFDCHSTHPVCCVVDGSIINVNKLGWVKHFGLEHEYDLYMASEKQQGWINIYNRGIAARPYGGDVYHSEAEAKAAAGGRCDTIHIEWEE